MRRWLWTTVFAALIVLLAQPARADARDGGAAADASVGVGPGASGGAGTGAILDAGVVDAAAAETWAPPPAPAAPATTPEMSSASLSTTTPLVGPPTPEQAEPPRPITRRLWFWMAVTGVIIAGVVGGMVLANPNVTRPECPQGYVCPR